MLNTKLIKIIKIIVSIVVITLVFAMGYFLGDGLRKNSANKTIKDTLQQTKNSNKDIENQLKEKTQGFLIAFYTKKDLGENRDRYRPFVTEGMYNSIVADEEKAVNKAYQGYIVDWEYQDADMYINSDKLEVLVNVRYKNTTLAIKDDKSKQTTQNRQSSYKITFTKVDNKLLVNKTDQMLIEPVADRKL